MTFKIPFDKSSEIVYYSNVRSDNDSLEKNISLKPLIASTVVKSKVKTSDNETNTTSLSTIDSNKLLEDLSPLPILEFSDLVERTFIISINN